MDLRQMPKATPTRPRSRSPARSPARSRSKSTKTCFATVGTTEFAALVDALLSADVLAALAAQGHGRLLIQLGKGPEPVVPKNAPLAIEWYRFKPSLEADMRDATLLISHAGAGSILEGMRLGKRMLVVVNDKLMHNHQQELAQELHSRQHLISTTPGALLPTLREYGKRPPALVPLPPADERAFGDFMAATLGF